MTPLFIVFILIFIFGWVLPRVLPHLLKWFIRRRVNQFAQQMRDAAGPNHFATDSGQGQEAPKPPVRKKKIDPGVGEYIRFEEVTVEASATETTDSATGTRRVDTSVKVEDQIIDVEWEDLPPVR